MIIKLIILVGVLHCTDAGSQTLQSKLQLGDNSSVYGGNPWHSQTADNHRKVSNFTYMQLGIEHMNSPDFQHDWIEVTVYEKYLYKATHSIPYKGFRMDATTMVHPAVWNVNDRMEVFKEIDYTDHFLYEHDHNDVVVIVYKQVHRISCLFDLSLFPFDIQQCNAYYIVLDDTRLRWSLDDPTVEFHQNFGLHEFTIRKWRTELCEDMYDPFDDRCAVFRLWLERKHQFYLITLISFASFWIDYTEVRARVGMIITCVLTMITLVIQKTTNFGQLTAQDIWLIFHMHAVVATLIEYIIVTDMVTRGSKKAASKLKVRPEEFLHRVGDTISGNTEQPTPVTLAQPGGAPGQHSSTIHDGTWQNGNGDVKLISGKGDGNKKKKYIGDSELRARRNTTMHEDTTDPTTTLVLTESQMDAMNLKRAKLPKPVSSQEDIKQKVERIEWSCRFIFPIGYIVFVLIFFIVIWSSDTKRPLSDRDYFNQMFLTSQTVLNNTMANLNT